MLMPNLNDHKLDVCTTFLGYHSNMCLRVSSRDKIVSPVGGIPGYNIPVGIMNVCAWLGTWSSAGWIEQLTDIAFYKG